MTFLRAAIRVVGVATALPALAGAQGEISGRVTTSDSARLAVARAEAVIGRIQRAAVTDSSGRFRMKDVPTGVHTLVIRAIGFRAESSVVEIQRDDVVSLDIRLEFSDATKLPERVVTAPEERVAAKLVEFTERQKAGIGHFIDRKQLEHAEGGMRLTGDLLSTIPGVRVRRSGSKIWIASGRTPTAGCAFCTSIKLDRADSAAGAKPACYMDVYLDGALVFDSSKPHHGLFDVNTVRPEQIAGMEVYTGPAQTPIKYNRTAAGCGVLLIWTR
jgi:hypothetical protein